MTVDQFGGGDMTAFTDEDMMAGLEDFETSDLSAPPRINIVHSDGEFEVSTTNETFKTLECIILGLVKQRIMWHPDIPAGEAPPPMCKSTDFKHGFPEMSEEVDKEYRFPWGASGFDRSKDLIDLSVTENAAPNTKPALSCESCKFKEWGTDPKGDRPWCSEDWVFAVLYKSEDGGWNPALLSLKRSAIKPVKRYVGAFATSRTPMFTCKTKIGLDVNKRGSVKYSVPTFSKGEATDQGEWTSYLEMFKGVRDYLKAFPQFRTDDDNSEGSAPMTGADATESPWGDSEAKSEPAAPKAAPKKEEPVVEAEVVADDDDEPPF